MLQLGGTATVSSTLILRADLKIVTNLATSPATVQREILGAEALAVQTSEATPVERNGTRAEATLEKRRGELAQMEKAVQERSVDCASSRGTQGPNVPRSSFNYSKKGINQLASKLQ